MPRLLSLFGGGRSDHARRLAFVARHRVLMLLIALGVSAAAIAAVAGTPPDRDNDGLPDAAEIRLGTYAKNVADSDGDGVPDRDEDANLNGIIDPLETDPARSDTDGDGLSDGIEWGISPISINGVGYTVPTSDRDKDGDGWHNGRDLDSDKDGISDAEELTGTYYPRFLNKQSNPYLDDSDGDGLFDRDELTWGTDPAATNSDGDGLGDGQEVAYRTDPLKTDTDGDLLPDGQGVDGLDADADGDGYNNALDWDSDNDGLGDGDEDLNDNGYEAGEMDPSKFDTDGDGWPDGYEFHRRFAPFDMNPVVAEPDADADGLPNGIEVAWWKTLPNTNDSDSDGIPDMKEAADSVGFTVNTKGDKLPLDSDLDGLPNALDRDSDNDGLSDLYESATQPDQDPVAPGVQRTSPWSADTDADGLSDALEINVYGTNPLSKHSDVDAIEDGDEVKTYKTDPRTSDTDGDGVPEALTGNEGVTVDSDGDGRANAIERDSDNDGLPDGTEDADHSGAVNGTETSPILADTDNDGLPDWYEVRILGASASPATRYAIATDGDGDGISDFDELRSLGSRSVPSTDPAPQFVPAKQVIHPFVSLAKGEEDKRAGIAALKTEAVRDAAGYLANDSDTPGGPAFSWVEITGVGTPVALTGDDVVSAPVAMGMSFPFYGSTYTTVRVCTNGFLSFTDTNDEFTNQPLPNPGAPANMVAPLWDDLHFDAVQRAYTYFDGTRFIVQWQNVRHFGTGGPYTFQALLYPNGNIEYQYLSIAAPTNSATIGIQNATKGVGLNVAFNAPYLHDNLAVRLVATNRHWMATDPTRADSDGDGVSDAIEYNLWHSNPLSRDTDGDGIEDGQQVTVNYIDGAGSLQTDVYLEDDSDPDNDGVPNVLDVDSDSDKIFQLDFDYRDRTENAYFRPSPLGQLGPLNPGNIDSDHDQVTDIAEIRGGSNPLDARQSAITPTVPLDNDGDGLWDDEEAILGLAAGLDSDGDGLNDGEELDPTGIDYDHAGVNPPGQDLDGIAQLVATSPLTQHSDSDGITDRDEIDVAVGRAIITDPHTADSDGDRATDDQDGGAGTDASDLGPVNPDRDGDTLLDGWEDADNSGGQNGNETDAVLRDTDNDGDAGLGMDDAHERYQWETDAVNPVNGDKDGDGVSDSQEILNDGTDPSDGDTDHDRLADGVDASPATRDDDNDLLVDGHEVTQAFTSYGAPGSVYPGLGKAYDPGAVDSDADAMWDGAEAALALPVGASLGKDADGDGLEDGQEAPTVSAVSKELLGYQTAGSYLADPNQPDSDGDGVNDGVETLANADDTGGSNAMDVDADDDWIRDGVGAEDYVADLDADGATNAADGDSRDNDRLLDPVEYFLFDVGPNNDTDADDDGLLDGNEYEHYFFNPVVHTLGDGVVANDDVHVFANPLQRDSDYDGLMDGLEAGLARAQAPSPVPGVVHDETGPGAEYDFDASPAPASATSESDPGRWDSDVDGLADGVEDRDRNGRRADHTPLNPAGETSPKDEDTDGDDLFDGTEDANRTGTPVYGGGDLADPLDTDTDNDALADGLEAGADVAFVAGAEKAAVRAPNDYFTKVTIDDTDGDGLKDGQEDSAPSNGAVDPGETDPNLCDTDNDQTKDQLDTQPLDPLLGGAEWALTTLPPVTATATPTGTNADFFKTTWPIVATNTSLKDLQSFYVVMTEFTWAADYGGYVTPPGYAHPPIPADKISIKLPGALNPEPGLDNCYTLLANGAHAYEFGLKNIPASTPPGSYEGTIYFLGSALACQSGQLPCPTHGTPGPASAASTLTHYDSMRVTINIPPYYDLDVLNADNLDTDHEKFGVGYSNPPEFFSGPAVSNEMHLKGMAKHDGDLTGVFRVSVPNGDASNGQPVYPSPKWDADPPSNARLNAVKFRFEATSVPAFPASAISFDPIARTNFDLGTEQTVVIKVNTNNLGECGSGGRFVGNLIAWHDLDDSGIQEVGEDGDQFTLQIELVTPDLDIQDDQGSLAANRLEASVNPAASLPQWTIRAANPWQLTNYDAFDGPGCEAFDTPSVFQAQTKVLTPILTNVPVGVTPTPGSTATFTVVKYDPSTQTYDPTKSFRVMVWSEQSGTIARDGSQEFKLGVDPTSLTSNPPQGLYTPYYDANHGDNQYALLSAVGTASGHTRAARGYPVSYAGTGTTSPEYGLFDRFQVFLTYQPGCTIVAAPSTPSPQVLNPGDGGTVTSEITNVLCNVTGLVLSRTALIRDGGSEVISDVTLSIDQNTLNPAEVTTARVVVRPADCQLDGRYRSTITVTGNSGSGPVAATFEVIVDVNSKVVAAPVPPPTTADPGLPFSWTVTVNNSGTAPIKVSELQASLPTLTGPGAPIANLTIDPNPATISIAVGGSQDFTVNGTSAPNQAAGTYTGIIDWVVCSRPAVGQQLTLGIGVLPCAMQLETPAKATVDPGHCVIITMGLTNGACAISGLSLSSSPLTGPGGVIPVTLDIDKNSLVAAEQTTVRLTACPPACMLDGTYTSVLTITGTTAFGPETVTRPITVNVTSKVIAAAPVDPVTVNPGLPIHWDVTVSNDGTAPIEIGELQASLPTLTGPGVPIGGLTITPNPGTVSIAVGANRTFGVNATSAANQQAGDYSGSIDWVVCNRPAVGQQVTVRIPTLPCALQLQTPPPATVDPSRCVTIAMELTNGECAISGLTVSSSPLTGPGGVIPVTLDIDKNSLVPFEKTTVRLSACPAACLLDGSYNSTLTVTGTTSFGPETAVRPIAVNVTSKSVAASPVAPVSSNPGVPIRWDVSVSNNGTAPVEVGELHVALPTLERTTTGTSDPVGGLSISPDPGTVSIPVGTARTFQVSAPLGADQRDGRYQGSLSWVVCNRPAVGQGLTVDVNAVPAWSYSVDPVNLICGVPQGIMVTNQGNTDLVLTLNTVSGPEVEAEPLSLPVPYRGAPQSVTLKVLCGTLTAGLKNGLVVFQDGASGPTRSLTVNTLVGEVPSLIPAPSPAGRGVPGGVVTIKIPIENMGNVKLNSVRIIEARDFTPVRGGAPIPFPPLPIPAVDRPLDIGARDTIVISVPVGSGYFAGTYTSRVTLGAVSGAADTFAFSNLSFDLSSTPNRQMAFSNNPVRFAQAREVTIAVSVTGKPASIKIYNSVGVLVRTLANSQTLTGGATTWDFKNDDGVLVASGVYVVVVEIDGQRHKDKLLFIK